MQAFRYKKLDTFTSNGSLGNPAAVLYLSSGQKLSESDMLDIARQHKGFVCEVIYCAQNADSIALTYYSSECEVDFCGHGTIACMYSLIKETPELLLQKEICIHTNKKGDLTVFNKIQELDAVFITAPLPVYIGTDLNPCTVSQHLGVAIEKIHMEHPIDVIDAGLSTLIVPITDLNTEISIFPDIDRLKEFCIANNMDIIVIYSLDVADKGYIAHTRVFAPKFGYLEDPATGSGNSAFGYYMLKYGLWDGSDCQIEQGGNDRMYNSIRLSSLNGKVLFGGGATIRIDGIYYI
jgi:PhzF family phenazine biosynthesis protein